MAEASLSSKKFNLYFLFEWAGACKVFEDLENVFKMSTSGRIDGVVRMKSSEKLNILIKSEAMTAVGKVKAKRSTEIIVSYFRFHFYFY